MTPYVRHGLHFALLRQFFSLLLLLLQFEALSGCLELLLVHNKEVTGAAFGEVGLSQNVLDAGDRRDLTLVVDILELVHLVGLVYDSISFLKMNKFVLLSTGRLTKWMLRCLACSLITRAHLLLGCLAHLSLG